MAQENLRGPENITVDDLRNYFRYWDYTRRVDGWLSEGEALLLFARAIRPEVARILEIGCWKGRSSTLFAQVGRDYRKQFHAVDDFSGRGDLEEEARRENVNAMFLGNMNELPYQLHHPSEVTNLIGATGSFDLVYIDGCHLYEAVRHDIEMLRPVSRCIVGHDYSLPSVRRAVNELLPARTRPVHDMWMWERDPGRVC